MLTTRKWYFFGRQMRHTHKHEHGYRQAPRTHARWAQGPASTRQQASTRKLTEKRGRRDFWWPHTPQKNSKTPTS